MHMVVIVLSYFCPYFNFFSVFSGSVSMSPRDRITRNDSIPEESITAVMPVTQSQPERTRRLITVEVVCVLYACYFGMMFPLQSQYVYRRINEQNLNNETINITEGNCTTPNYSSPSYKHGQQSRSEASLTMAYINLAQMIPVVFTTLFMGSYSDRTGRKFPMILPIIGAIVHSILTCLVIGLNLPLPLLTVGAFLDGISGGSATLFMVVFSYTADISSTERRTIRMVVAEICIGSGAVVSSFATGVVIEKLGFFYSFFIVIGFNLLNLLYIIFLIKETLPRQEDSKFFSCRHLRGTLNVYTNGSVPGRRYRLIICLVILFIVCAVQIGRPDAETYFLIGAPFCWSSILIGTYSSTLYLIGSVSSLLTTWLLEHVAGTLFLMFLGSISGVALETIFAFSRTKLHVFLCEYILKYFISVYGKL